MHSIMQKLPAMCKQCNQMFETYAAFPSRRQGAFRQQGLEPADSTGILWFHGFSAALLCLHAD